MKSQRSLPLSILRPIGLIIGFFLITFISIGIIAGSILCFNLLIEWIGYNTSGWLADWFLASILFTPLVLILYGVFTHPEGGPDDYC